MFEVFGIGPTEIIVLLIIAGFMWGLACLGFYHQNTSLK